MTKIIQRTSTFVALLTVLLIPTIASAVDITITGGGDLGLSGGSLEETVVRVIQWVLGFLALIAVIMIIIGGFRWMTAAGNEEKIASAKKIISAAIVGLVVVLLAWAIVIFVGNAVINSANA